MVLVSAFVVALLPLPQLCHKFLSLFQKKRFLLGYLSQPGQLSIPIEHRQKLLFFVLHQHQLTAQPALLDQFDVPEEFLEGQSLGGEDLLAVPEDILEGGYFLLDNAFQHLLFGPSNLLLVVVVNFHQPEFLEPRLLLHFALEDPKLRNDPQRGEYTFSFLLDLRLRGQFVGLGALLDAPALGLRVLGEGLLLGDIFFGDQRFHDD